MSRPKKPKFKLYWRHPGTSDWHVACSGRFNGMHKSREHAERCQERIGKAYPYEFKIEEAS